MYKLHVGTLDDKAVCPQLLVVHERLTSSDTVPNNSHIL